MKTVFLSDYSYKIVIKLKSVILETIVQNQSFITIRIVRNLLQMSSFGSTSQNKTKVLQMQEEISDQGKFVECLQFQLTDRNIKGNFLPQVVAVSNDRNSYLINQKGKVILQVESIEQYFKFTDDSKGLHVAYFIQDTFRILLFDLKKQELESDEQFEESKKKIQNFTILKELCFYFTIRVVKPNERISSYSDTPKIIPNQQKVQIQDMVHGLIVLVSIDLENEYQQYLVYCGYRNSIRIRKQYLCNVKTQAIHLKNGIILTSPNLRLIQARDGKIIRTINFPELKNSIKAYIKEMHLFVLFQNGFFQINLYSGAQNYEPLLNTMLYNFEKPKYFKISPTEFLTLEEEVRKTHAKRILKVKVFKLQP